VLPLPPGQPTASFSLTGSFGIAPGQGPVFVLDEQLFPLQCGRARLDRNGRLRLYAYAGALCRSATAWRSPLLLPADPRVPWVLVPEPERRQLRQLGEAALSHLQAVLRRAMTAAFFVAEYRPVIEAIVSQALRDAADAPAVTRAVRRFSDSLQERQRLQGLLDGLVPVVGEKARDNLWRTLSGATATLFGSDGPRAREALVPLLDEVLADPRVRSQLAQTLPALLSDPETLALGSALVAAAGQAVAADPRLPQLLERLIGDPRFLGLHPIGADAERLFTRLPASLLRMRHAWDHNPLATYVLRTQVRGQPAFLVLLPDAAQERQLSEAGLPLPAPLKRTLP
jgi:hypothetical protein